MGRGVTYKTGSAEGDAFKGNGAKITEPATIAYDRIQKHIVKSAYEQAKSLEANASASMSGWGATVKAEMAKSKESELARDEVKFVASRVIKHGFKGW